MAEKKYMQLALDLASQARGRTSPNPLVGSVIIKDNQIIAKGYHHYAGGEHAEVNALQEAGDAARGATMYVTLEPCSHHGKQPPCVDAIIKAGINKVIVAMVDPNPLVAGTGIKLLKEAGIEVEVGVLSEEAKLLNENFIKYITTGLPFVISKSAITLDGKIATKTGDSKWITGLESRKLVHQLRDEVDAILVGAGTVLADNPRLTTRLVDPGEDPIRVILDDRLEIPLDAKVIKKDSSAKTIIITTNLASESKVEKLKEIDNLELILLSKEELNIAGLLEELGKREIMSLLVEGGSRINASFLQAGMVDKIYYFIAPKIIGGGDSICVVAGPGVNKMEKAIKIKKRQVKEIGEDILITGYPEFN